MLELILAKDACAELVSEKIAEMTKIGSHWVTLLLGAWISGGLSIGLLSPAEVNAAGVTCL